MNIGENFDICEHIAPGAYPFIVELAIDDHLGLTDGIVRCRDCQRVYLLEMLDWLGNNRVFRISLLADDHAQRLIRDLTRGSCDVRRAGAEVQHLKTASAFARCLILIDSSGPQIAHIAPLPLAPPLPSASWRELPCDGSWVNYLQRHQAPGPGRSNTAIENG